MRLLTGCLIFITCAILFALPVSAENRQQTHSIELEVECLDTAMEVIHGLNGYNLESAMFVNEVFNRSPQRVATFTRRVDNWAFRHAQEALRGLGEVLFEVENARFLGGELADVEVRLSALSQEIDRLTVMMAASDSLEVMIAIDIRLSQVTLERNRLIGRRNVLQVQAASPIIHIWMVETPEDMPDPAPPGFGSRVAESFGASWRSIRDFAGNLLVFIVRISIPLAVWIIILTLLAIVIWFGFRRKIVRYWPSIKKRLLLMPKDITLDDESESPADKPSGEEGGI